MITKPKMLWVDHAFHRITKSNDFCKDVFREYFDVIDYFVEVYENGKMKEDLFDGIFSNIDGNYYDVVVFLQLLPPVVTLQKIRFRKLLFIPMYDGAPDRADNIWQDYKDLFSVISFSKTLHDELCQINVKSDYVQYFPKPHSFENWGCEKSVFLWQRVTAININVISELFQYHGVERYHIHKAVDPEQQFVEPCANIKRKCIFSEWYADKSMMFADMEKCAFYIAPRLYEGIGMSFLEAMALGRCVVAVDHPTMNEYIKHDETGLLFKLDAIEPLCSVDVRKLQQQGFEYIIKGYQAFEKNKSIFSEIAFA